MKRSIFLETLESLHLSGKLNRNTAESNRQAIREFIAGNSYWTFGLKGAAHLERDYDEIAKLMSERLGISVYDFNSDKDPYIDPKLTADGLIEMRLRLESAAARGQRVLFSTAHPGSMFSFYATLAQRYEELGGQVCRLDTPVPAPDNRWIDDVMGVMMLSDEGNLMHTHDGSSMESVIESLTPDLVVSDHGFAISSVNSRCSTIALFDVDDPAVPVAADLYPDRVWAIPMNDNQTNVRTAKIAEALWQVEL